MFTLGSSRLQSAAMADELTARKRRGVARRIWLARGFIALLVFCLAFGWMRGGPVFPRIVGSVFSFLWASGMAMYIRQQQRQLNTIIDH
jgi:hypothetical protein